MALNIFGFPYFLNYTIIFYTIWYINPINFSISEKFRTVDFLILGLIKPMTSKSFVTFEKIVEIVQLCLVLFGLSMFVSFVISNFFTWVIDPKIDEISDDNERNVAIVFSTFFQLIVTAIAYFLIDTLLYKITPWFDWFDLFKWNKSSNKCAVGPGTTVKSKLGCLVKPTKRNLKQLETVDYAIHIVLIIMLIEMNASLTKNLHKVSCMVTVNSDKLDACH